MTPRIAPWMLAIHALPTSGAFSITRVRMPQYDQAHHSMCHTDARPAREMRWAAVATVSAPCNDAMAAFLAKGAESDLILRVDESVTACEPVKQSDESFIDGDAPIPVGDARRYRCSITPLVLPGLRVETMALIRVEPIPNGVRYVTERIDNSFGGAFGNLVGGLPAPLIAISTELTVRDSDLHLVGHSDFLLTTPLPSWWPIPDRLMAAGGALIKRLVQRDTQLSVRRIVAECERECE